MERTRKGTEEYVVWEKRRRRTGLCRYSDYYVGRPAQRTTEQRYSETVFELRPEQVTVRPSPMALRLLASTMQTTQETEHVLDGVSHSMVLALEPGGLHYGSFYAQV